MDRWNSRLTYWLLLQFVQSISTGCTFPPAIKSLVVNGSPGYRFVLSKEGDVKITCEAEVVSDYSEYPRIELRFSNSTNIKKEWKKRQEGSLSLVIPSSYVKLESSLYEDSYVCIVSNTAGVAVSSPVTIRFADISVSQVEFATYTVATAHLGGTAILPCNSSGAVIYRPTLHELEPKFSWYFFEPHPEPGETGVVPIRTNKGSRFAMDDIGTLYIKNATKDDERLQPKRYYCQISGGQIPITRQPGSYVGSYTLQLLHPTIGPSSTPRLIYKSQDTKVTIGSNVYLSCIFEESTAACPVTWNRIPQESYGNGSLIKLTNVTEEHNGTWECKCKEVSASISVKILEYPMIADDGDVYAKPGDAVRLLCNLKRQQRVAFNWFRNEESITSNTKYFIIFSENASTLIIKDVTKFDAGVYRCSATNELATVSFNRRLIISDPAELELVALDRTTAEGDYSLAVLTDNITVARFLCNYSVDASASDTKVVWQLERFAGNITEETRDLSFGLLPGSVHTSIEIRQSILTIHHIPESTLNIRGYVRCLLSYKILNKQYFSAAPFLQKIRGVVSGQVSLQHAQPFPFWIIGVLIAATLAVMIVVLIVRYVHQNKGEQYYVEKKEIQSGHDPKRLTRDWSEFKRPDRDPPAASMSPRQYQEGEMQSLVFSYGGLQQQDLECDTL